MIRFSSNAQLCYIILNSKMGEGRQISCGWNFGEMVI